MKTRKSFVLAMAVTICFGLGGATVAVASGPTVTSHVIDLTTKGDWVGTYGECFYLLPDPVREGEDPIADDNVCFGGSFDDQGRIFWDLVAGNPASAANIFVWSLTGIYSPQQGAEQWNPCEDDYKAATFDNGDLGIVGNIFNPLTNELTIDYDGCLTLSYYFSEAATKCRQQEYQLWVNGVSMGSDGWGLVNDLSWGKYVVFEVCGLEGQSTILLDVQNTLNETCIGLGTYPNTHFSGVFVSDCEEEEVGTGTPGYFKKASHWPAGVEEIEVGGRTFPQDEAIDYLKENKAKGNKCLTMFNALVAAKLNVINGAQSWCVDDTISSADGWFGDYCAQYDLLSNPLPASNPAWGMVGEPLYWTLDDYNNGLLCAPHRD
jgi:hypothetical protein